jgi:hypothetical protein
MIKSFATFAAVLFLGTGFRPSDTTSTERTGQAVPTVTPAARAAAAPARREARHVSLLIGVGAYRHEYFIIENDGRFRSALSGTTNDVNRMKASLRGWGFAEGDHQRVLLDRQASKQGIADAFRWLAEQASDSNDVVVIYYSGHGSWAPDANGDEEDGFDEAIVPWDTREMHNPAHLVTDDELGEWLNQIRTSNITVIIDACHSGSTTRGAPDEDFPRGRGPKSPQHAVVPPGGMLSGGDQNLNHVLLTGASAWELAYEDRTPEGLIFGKFTYHLTQVLDNAQRGSTTYDQVMRLVHTRLGVDRQTPQLEGDGAAVVFRVHEGVPARAFAVVSPVRGSVVQLDLGAVHGVRTGSVFDVYGPEETSFVGAAAAQVRVDSISPEVSYATVLGTGTVPASGRAVLSRVPQGAVALDRLRVYVDPSARDATTTLGSFTEWVEVTANETAAHAVLRKRNDLYEVLVSGEYVAPRAADYQSGLARGGPGQTVGVGRGFLGSPEALCGPLRRAHSIAGLQLIQNSIEELRVDIRLLPANATPPPRPDESTVDTAYVGDTVSVYAWVIADEGQVRRTDVFLTAAVSGFTANPFALRPQGTAPITSLTPGEVNRPIPIARNIVISPITGIEILKVLAGTERFDFRSYMNRLPSCERALGSRGPDEWASVTPEIRGWSAAERRVEILPR